MKIGVLGYGSIGSMHFANIEKLGHQAHWYDPNIPGHGLRDLVIEHCDAIIVASPSKQHAHDLTDAIDAGKHVLVEKPFGYDCPPYLDGYVQGARGRFPNLIIATGFNCRFHLCVARARHILRSGKLGDIQAASFSVLQKSEKPEYLRDGIIRNWLSHEIDLAHAMFGKGEVEMCTADDQREANITMKFPTVADHVYITGDYFTEPHQRYFWIEGSRANLYVNLEKREIYIREGNSTRLIYQSKDTWDDTYIEEMELFIQSIECGGHLEPLATGEDGIRCLYTVMSARASAGL
jgi:predicted dehydrogenase